MKKQLTQTVYRAIIQHINRLKEKEEESCLQLMQDRRDICVV